MKILVCDYEKKLYITYYAIASICLLLIFNFLRQEKQSIRFAMLFKNR